MTRRRATHLEPLEYQQLASFRYALRSFLRFSEAAAEKLGLTAQHYQALLAVCAAPGGVTINDLAQQLLIRHNSAVGLVDRLAQEKLIVREPSNEDRRRVDLHLTARGRQVLAKLAALHRGELKRIGPTLERFFAELSRVDREQRDQAD